MVRDDSWSRSLAGLTVGKYKLLRFIGSGKIGFVYLAEHSEFPGSEYAVKLIFDTLKPGWDVELKKVILLALIPGIVHFHELGTAQITHKGGTRLCQFTVWDYIAPGESLNKYLERVGEIETSFLVVTVERILHVLHACKVKNVVRHGDLHSGNILIGEPTAATLDDSLQQRAPIFVSDFGYGATGAERTPKDDYAELAHIINEMSSKVMYATATTTDRHMLQALKRDFGKYLSEPPGFERRPPLDLLNVLKNIMQRARAHDSRPFADSIITGVDVAPPAQIEVPSVGQFQVSEMIGDRWDWWKRLFVPTVPARSKILALDIPTIVTGPRGCGKTMLFRRLSERLVVECGKIVESPIGGKFVGFYVNANDFADAFPHFPERPAAKDEARLVCYANLCVLADFLAVQSAHTGQSKVLATDSLLKHVQEWLLPDAYRTLLEGEDRLERYRTILEQVKWKFPGGDEAELFPGYVIMSQYRWLASFLEQARKFCPWVGDRSVLLFIDDYSTPRISMSMQRVLNRLFLQRSPHFLAKLATEASSTFIPEDSSGKNLEDGDDYQLVDLGEESLFLPDLERKAYLNNIFTRRLELDQRIPRGNYSLEAFLGQTGISKTEFARRLRTTAKMQSPDQMAALNGSSQRRGRTRARVLYSGESVFLSLWSGDTRTMIQLITDVVDQAYESVKHKSETKQMIILPVNCALQDRVFRNRGGEWLSSHTRNEPTNPQLVKEELAAIQKQNRNYRLCGEYGDHLKAVVEAFVAAARSLLLSAPYRIRQGKTEREVPRMAFRIEIVDEFRINSLAKEIYRDLIRYGLFIRDSRGKSVRGTFVPRLFLRRLLLPYATLATSKRDSVTLRCNDFITLLLEPDTFKANIAQKIEMQVSMPLFGEEPGKARDPAYDDLDDEKTSDLD